MRETMLMLHFFGLAMGLGTSFAHAFLGVAIAKMESSEAKKFRVQIKALSLMGTIGTLLLLISGIFLMAPYWSVLTSLPILIIKLVLFLILVILILLINQGASKNSETEDSLKKIGIMGKLALLTGVAIVILAVNIFH